MPVVVAALIAPSPSRAQELRVVARATGGFDSNPTLSASPENRRGAPAGLVVPDGFGRADLGLRAEIGATPWGRAALDSEARVYGNGERRAWERLALSAGTRAGRFTPGLRVEGSRYDASGTEDSAWAGRVRLGLGLDLVDGLVLDGDALVGLRAYDVGGQTDTLAGGGVSLTGSTRAVRLAGGVDLDRRYSTDALARRTEVVPWISLRVAPGPVEIELEYAAFVRRFDATSRDGVEHIARLTTSVALVSWLRALASVEVGIARGEADALAYERVEALGGLELRWGSERASSPIGLAPSSSEPARATAEGVRFRFTVPGAHDVRVVGTFNEWDPERGRLRSAGQGVFEGALPAAPGHHRYHLIVDGEPRRPAGAARYVADDLGGEDAVLTVGAEN